MPRLLALELAAVVVFSSVVMSMKVQRVVMYLILAAVVNGALLASVAIRLVWPEQRWMNIQLHSTMEALGGLAAIVMAFVLLQRRQEPGGDTFSWLAPGFLAMGLLEEFHAVAPLGHGMVVLRSAASLLGGVGFALVWLPDAKGSRWRGMPWAVASGCLAFGLWTLVFPDRLPQMMRGGEFTATAIAPKSLACMLFIAGAVHFLRDFHHSGKSEDYLFASLAVLFGTAELMFTYSAVWDGGWWLWHALRLMTYALVLGYVSRDYLRIVSDLTGALGQAKRAEGSLRQALGEREQLSRDLHDGIIQSIYAIGLSLAECRRLVAKNAAEAVRQLGEAIADLNGVIRDVRNHIIGLEPESMKRVGLETALTSFVRTMEGAHALHFRLQLDPTAVRLLTQEQATHVRYIAREAMSNSLRHSRAQNGVVSLLLQEGRLRLEVEDDGVGFDTNVTGEQGDGLRNIRARAREMGARCEISSRLHGGTRIVLEIPIPMEVSHAQA
jgi:signal transduction histidine kinase